MKKPSKRKTSMKKWKSQIIDQEKKGYIEYNRVIGPESIVISHENMNIIGSLEQRMR